MRRTLENTDHLTIRQAEVTELIVEEGKIRGVKTYSGAVYYCKAVVLATGTYSGHAVSRGMSAMKQDQMVFRQRLYLTASLEQHGIEMYRFKTGTPARVDKRSIDFDKLEEQKGDERIVPFLSQPIQKPCRKNKLLVG